MTHLASEYKEVLLLRSRKKSYSEINKLTKIPKSTLSDWLSDEDWSIKIKDELADKHLINYKPNLLKSMKILAEKKKLRHVKFCKEAFVTYNKFKNDPLFSFGLGLYWGEGDKKSGNSVAVTNTDPNMLRVIASFFRKYFSVDESKLRVRLFVYKDIDVSSAKKFWSELLQVPQNQFIKIQVLESKAKLTKTKSKYGICSLYCSNTEFHIKIMEWIRLLSLDMRV